MGKTRPKVETRGNKMRMKTFRTKRTRKTIQNKQIQDQEPAKIVELMKETDKTRTKTKTPKHGTKIPQYADFIK